VSDVPRFQLKDGYTRAVTHAFGATSELSLEAGDELATDEAAEVAVLRAHPAIVEVESEDDSE